MLDILIPMSKLMAVSLDALIAISIDLINRIDIANNVFIHVKILTCDLAVQSVSWHSSRSSDHQTGLLNKE